jgi:hypothetical protein
MLRSVWFWFAVVCTVLLMIPVGFEAPPGMGRLVAATGSGQGLGAGPEVARDGTGPQLGPAGIGEMPYFPEILPQDLPVLAETAAVRAMMLVSTTQDGVTLGPLMLSEIFRGLPPGNPDPLHLLGRCGGGTPSAYLVTSHEPDVCRAP